jgi:hypothetical protein
MQMLQSEFTSIPVPLGADMRNTVLIREHGVHIGLFLLVVFVNLFALFYGFARLVFLKDTGVKLHHLDRQLATRDTVLADLTRRIQE